MAQQPLLDRDTAFGMIIGGAMGARGWTFGPALAATLVASAFAYTVTRMNPATPIRVPNSVPRFLVDTATTMSAWWLGKVVLSQPAAQLPAPR